MNRTYRLIWNRSLHVMQVVSELTHSSSAGAPAASTHGLAQPRPLVLVLAVCLGLMSTVPAAQAASISGGNGSRGQNGTAVNGVPQGGAGGVGSLPGVNDGTLGYSFGGGTYAKGGKGGSLANKGVGGGGEGGQADGGIGGGGGGGGGNLALLITQSATNTDYIHGGYGGSGGDGGAGFGASYLGNGNGGGGGGGAGVLITSGASWTNNQVGINGGDGGNGEISGYDSDGSGNGGDGGDAVMATDGSGFVNLSSVEVVRAGSGGIGRRGGDGGVGFEAGNSVNFVNGGDFQGQIIGGYGGRGVTVDDVDGEGGDGGNAVVLGAHSTALNDLHGTITGGAGGMGRINGDGGNAVELGDASTMTTRGRIAGGHGGTYCNATCTPGNGGVGVLVLGSAHLTNTYSTLQGYGSEIIGGYGTLGWDLGGNGGNGVDLTGPAGTLTNTDGAYVIGGEGGGGSTLVSIGGRGGIGVDVSEGAIIINSDKAVIKGGVGGAGSFSGGAAGAGVNLATGAELSNTALVYGGNGGYGVAGVGPGQGGKDGIGGTGGVGVLLAKGATLTNEGDAANIYGGVGGTSGDPSLNGGSGVGGAGGAGVVMAAGSTFKNLATVQAGHGGHGAVSGFSVGGAGGVGIAVGADAKLDNSGEIDGGYGGGEFSSAAPTVDGVGDGSGGVGGAAVTLASGASLISTATGALFGADGGQSGLYAGTGAVGGNGATLSVDSSLTNSGGITGGKGGRGTKYAAARTQSGTGGGGVVLAGAGTLVNQGVFAAITGGAGGSNLDEGLSGIGGAGVTLGSGASLRNVDGASITGGEGISSRITGLSGGIAGVGVVANGNADILNAGMIAGGAPNKEKTSVQVDAVDFAGGSNRLTLENGYAFVGNVVSNSGAISGGDRLILGGDAAASFDVSRVATGSAATFDPNVGTRYFGFGQYQKTGTSTWTLVGTDTSKVDWQVSEGTLRGDASAIRGAVNLMPGSGATAGVTFDQGSTNANSGVNGSFAGVISGTGSVHKMGDGILVMAGDNTYTGGTTIDAGTLQIGAGGTTGSIVGDVVNNGAISFDRSDAVTFSGNISGSGSLQRAGSGTVELTGANTYTGGTSITVGTLQVGNGGSLGTLTGNVTNDGVLAFNRGDTLSFDGNIVGSGKLLQQGVGLLVLNGSSTFTGDTQVSAGTLEIGDSAHSSASIGGNVDVLAGAMLRGHGTIAGDVMNSGTVRPGGSVGVLTIAGNYVQNPGATLAVDVTPAQASQLNVLGTASLAGSLKLIYAPGTYQNMTYTLLQAQSISGTFAATSAAGAVPTTLNPQTNVGSQSVTLVLGSGSGTPVPPAPTPPPGPAPTPAPAPAPAPTPAPAPAPTPAPTGPTSPLKVSPPGGATYANRMRLIHLATERSLGQVLDLGVADSGTACSSGAQSTSRPAFAMSSCDGRVWARASGNSQNIAGQSGTEASGFSLLGGFDHSLGQSDVRLGLAAGLDRINSIDAQASHGHTDSAHLGIYGLAPAGPLVLSGTVDMTYSKYRIARATGVGDASVDPDGTTKAAGVQVAWPMKAAQWQIAPRLGMQYQYQRLEGFHEAVNSPGPLANAFGVDARRTAYTSLQGYAEVSISRAFQGAHVSYVPSFDLGYRRDLRGNVPEVFATAQDGTGFRMAGAPVGRNTVTVGARITAQAGDSWSVFLGYRGQFATHLRDNTASFGFVKYF